ncbi:MAG: lipoprotein [Sulfuricellaceae bacterium]
MRSIYLLVVLVLLLHGCGHRGPLYLPQKPQPNTAQPAVPTPAPSQEKQP